MFKTRLAAFALLLVIAGCGDPTPKNEVDPLVIQDPDQGLAYMVFCETGFFSGINFQDCTVVTITIDPLSIESD